MARRKRFSADEKAAFTVGALIEWQNGSHWHPAEIIAPIRTDSLGNPCVEIAHRGRSTATISRGQVLYGYPGKLRPATP